MTRELDLKRFKKIVAEEFAAYPNESFVFVAVDESGDTPVASVSFMGHPDVVITSALGLLQRYAETIVARGGEECPLHSDLLNRTRRAIEVLKGEPVDTIGATAGQA